MEHIYGYVNGKPVGSRDEFIFESRHRGPIESDEELLEFARKVTHNWLSAGWCRTFIGFYLSDYALAEPYCSLTKTEFNRLKELQAKAQAEAKAAEEAKGWKLARRDCYADNSVEETYVSKDGETKTVMVVAPHGDPC